MKREKILARLQQAAEERHIVAVWLRGRGWDEGVWPLRVSEDMALCAHDGNFALDGWDVFAIDAIERVTLRYDKYGEFAAEEGLLEQLTDPGCSVDSWQAFFAALPTDQLIGVERRHVPDGEAKFAVGRVMKAGKKRVHLICVDSEAVWEQEPWRIRYRDIEAVRIGDRYLMGFGRHAGVPHTQEEEPDAEDNGQT